jgi:hypothetical protein
MSENEPIVARLSLGFTEAEWRDFLACLTPRERAELLAHAAYAVPAATIGQERSFATLGCDLSYESSQEMAERLARENPQEMAPQPGLGDGARHGSNIIWFRA